MLIIRCIYYNANSRRTGISARSAIGMDYELFLRHGVVYEYGHTSIIDDD